MIPLSSTVQKCKMRIEKCKMQNGMHYIFGIATKIREEPPEGG
jgi:hypothetical protein